MAAPAVLEVLPPILDSTSDQPPLFDGTTRVFCSEGCISVKCPRMLSVCGLSGIIRVYMIKSSWFQLTFRTGLLGIRRKSTQKIRFLFLMVLVPALEHNGQVIGESLDLVKYVDSNFEGPALLPDDPAKLKFAEELVVYSDTFLNNLYTSLRGDNVDEAAAGFDYLETALHKFDDGSFFLGQFSQVDVVYAPFVERFHIIFQEIFKHTITSGRPKLAAWIEAINKSDAYKPTKCNPEKFLAHVKKRYFG